MGKARAGAALVGTAPGPLDPFQNLGIRNSRTLNSTQQILEPSFQASNPHRPRRGHIQKMRL
eukprot:CAMPEP_0198553890 /NCGR_PEP_ID=MMETSP1462-20131121/81378_1 /TAXON_ID=1333877 /ORGANISM="Brandtodinium nutriculum, Strain RCC3387" /LENGTH=61 /DNA_ID=CAMNT_0044284583 /DNA_START=102 /DNA_END=284 /DNA_ORIENTATION=-